MELMGQGLVMMVAGMGIVYASVRVPLEMAASIAWRLR